MCATLASDTTTTGVVQLPTRNAPGAAFVAPGGHQVALGGAECPLGALCSQTSLAHLRADDDLSIQGGFRCPSPSQPRSFPWPRRRGRCVLPLDQLCLTRVAASRAVEGDALMADQQ